MRRLSTCVALLAAGMLAACGGGGGDGGGRPTDAATDGATTPAAECSPSGTELRVSATGTAFDKDCLAAPADTEFTIEFEITDANTHNVAIEDGDASFDGEIFTGPKTMTYKVPAIPAGVYSFYCEVHPGPMRGTFVVE